MSLIPTKDSIINAKNYIMLGVAVFFVGLLWHFPIGKFQSGFTKQIEKQTGIAIQSDRVSFAFPIGLQFSQVSIRNIPIGSFLYDYQLDQLKVTVSPLSVFTFAFKKAGTVSFDIRQKEARIDGSAFVSPTAFALDTDAKKLKVDETLEFPDPLNPSVIKKIPIKSLVTLSAKIKGDLKQVQAGNFSSLSGNLKGNANATNLDAPIVGALEFSQINLDSKIDKGLLTLSTLNLTGPQFSGKANGTLLLKQIIEDSELKLESKITFGEKGTSLKSTVKTLGSLKGLKVDDAGTLSLKVMGPLSAPDVAPN